MNMGSNSCCWCWPEIGCTAIIFMCRKKTFGKTEFYTGGCMALHWIDYTSQIHRFWSINMSQPLLYQNIFLLDCLRLLSYVADIKYHIIIISDHSPVKLVLCSPNTIASWHRDILLLSIFKKYIAAQTDDFLERNITPDVSYCAVWEALKAYLRGEIIPYAVQTADTSLSYPTSFQILTWDIQLLQTQSSVR